MNLEQFEANIGYIFKNKKLLQTALTHKSMQMNTKYRAMKN